MRLRTAVSSRFTNMTSRCRQYENKSSRTNELQYGLRVYADRQTTDKCELENCPHLIARYLRARAQRRPMRKKASPNCKGKFSRCGYTRKLTDHVVEEATARSTRSACRWKQMLKIAPETDHREPERGPQQALEIVGSCRGREPRDDDTEDGVHEEPDGHEPGPESLVLIILERLFDRVFFLQGLDGALDSGFELGIELLLRLFAVIVSG